MDYGAPNYCLLLRDKIFPLVNTKSGSKFFLISIENSEVSLLNNLTSKC